MLAGREEERFLCESKVSDFLDGRVRDALRSGLANPERLVCQLVPTARASDTDPWTVADPDGSVQAREEPVLSDEPLVKVGQDLGQRRRSVHVTLPNRQSRTRSAPSSRPTWVIPVSWVQNSLRCGFQVGRTKLRYESTSTSAQPTSPTAQRSPLRAPAPRTSGVPRSRRT